MKKYLIKKRKKERFNEAFYSSTRCVSIIVKEMASLYFSPTPNSSANVTFLMQFLFVVTTHTGILSLNLNTDPVVETKVTFFLRHHLIKSL